MKNIFKRNDERLINAMCLAPGMAPAIAMSAENMSGKDIPRI